MASDKVHGITIEIDANTSGVSESFKDINKELNSTQKELKTVDKMLKTNGDDTRLLAQKQQLLTDAIDETQNKLVKLAKAKAEADNSDDIDKNSKAYRDLERDIISTQKALEDLNAEYKTNSNKMSGFADDVSDVSSSLDSASTSGLSFGDVLKANVIGDAIISGVKALASAFVDLGSAMYSTLRESGEFADDINTLAKQYNLTTDQLQLYSRASELVDVDLETIAKSMNKLTKNMTSTSSSVISAFQKLGVATTDSSGALRDSNEVFNELIEKLALVSNETEQDSLAMEIFGKSASDLGPLINGGVEQLDELNKKLQENSLILSQDELDALNQVNDSFDTMEMTWDAMKDKLSSQIAPAIQPILDTLATDVEESMPLINEVVDKIVNFITEHQDTFSEFINDAFEWMTSEDTKDFFDTLIELITEDIPELIENLNILKLDLQDIKGLLDIIVALAKTAVEWLNKILTFDLDSLFINSSAWQSFMDLGGGSISSGGFGDALQNLASGGFSSSGITLNNTINVNNNGRDISVSTINEWADIMTNRINDNLGRLL